MHNNLPVQIKKSKFQTAKKVGKYFKCQRYFTSRFLTFELRNFRLLNEVKVN